MSESELRNTDGGSLKLEQQGLHNIGEQALAGQLKLLSRARAREAFRVRARAAAAAVAARTVYYTCMREISVHDSGFVLSLGGRLDFAD